MSDFLTTEMQGSTIQQVNADPAIQSLPNKDQRLRIINYMEKNIRIEGISHVYRLQQLLKTSCKMAYQK